MNSKNKHQDLKNYYDNEELALIEIKKSGSNMQYLSERLRYDKKFILRCIRYFESPDNSLFISDSLRDDAEVVMEMVKKSFYFLDVASKRLKNDRDFMLKLVDISNNCFSYASYALKTDRDFVLKVVKINGELLGEVFSVSLKNDKEVVLEATKNFGVSLRHASKNLQSDKDCLEAFELNQEKPEVKKLIKYYGHDVLRFYLDKVQEIENLKEHEKMLLSIKNKSVKNKVSKF
jgi:hypothetical protein